MFSRREPALAAPGPARFRSCTDILCLLLWVAFLVGWLAVAGVVYSRSAPERLLRPPSSDGEPCGAAGTRVADQPYLAYLDITSCGDVTCSAPQTCVTQCPTATYDFRQYEDCSKPEVRKLFVCRSGVKLTAENCNRLLDDINCARVVVESVPMMGRCVPNIPHSETGTDTVRDHADRNTSVSISGLIVGARGAGQLTGQQSPGAGAFGDLQNTWWVLVAACAASALLSLLWIFLLRFVTATLLWTAGLGLLGVTVGGSVLVYQRYDRLDCDSDSGGGGGALSPPEAFVQGVGSPLDRPGLWLALFVILCSLAVGALLLLLALRKIRTASAMLRQASRAVSSSSGTLLFPLVTLALQLAVLALFLSVALYAASLGSPTYQTALLPNCSCTRYRPQAPCTPDAFEVACPGEECRGGCVATGFDPHPAAAPVQAWNVFALFWGLLFCSAFNELSLAGAFASWYWTFDKRYDLPRLPVLSSAGRAVRYHLGTAAFGSLIIDSMRMVRATLRMFSKREKERSWESCNEKIIHLCAGCCLSCFEKFLRFITRNAYIVCAIHGTSFCVSARYAFSLLTRNVWRVVAVTSSCEVMLLLGRLLITALVTLASCCLLEHRITIESSGRSLVTQHGWASAVTVAVASHFICSAFFRVYSSAVGTIFLCFLEDLERNDGSRQKPFYMSRDLMVLLAKGEEEDGR